MTHRQRLLWIALAVVAVGFGVIALQRAERMSNDFDNLYAAGYAVWHQGQLYLVKGTQRFPPTLQLLMAPFGAFPLLVSAGLWLLLSYAALAVLPRTLERLSGVAPREQLWAWFVATPFIVDNIVLGQSGPLLLALASLGMLWAWRGRPAVGGGLLTLAALFKVFPAALLAVPVVLHRARSVVLGVVLSGAALAGLLVAVVGADVAQEESSRWWNEVRQEQTAWRLIEEARSLRYNNQGLAVTLARSLTDFAKRPQLAAKGSVQLAAWPPAVGWALYALIMAVVAAVLLLLAWRARSRTHARGFFGLYALTALAMLFASPIVWTHYFIWWLPALVFLADRKRLLLGIGFTSLAALAWVPARGLGFHMAVSLLLFVLAAKRLWQEVGGAAAQAGHSPAATPGTTEI